MTINFEPRYERLLKASSAIPPVAPHRRLQRWHYSLLGQISGFSHSIAAETEVLAWPTERVVATLDVKPDKPPNWRSVLNALFCRLAIYGHMIDARHPRLFYLQGCSTLWSAIVSSTTPRLEAKCPPLTVTTATSSCLILQPVFKLFNCQVFRSADH